MCIRDRQWSKAAQLAETLDRDAARPHLKILARHHEEAGNHALAERFFVAADAPQLAVEMYTKVWQREEGEPSPCSPRTISETSHFAPHSAVSSVLLCIGSERGIYLLTSVTARSANVSMCCL